MFFCSCCILLFYFIYFAYLTDVLFIVTYNGKFSNNLPQGGILLLFGWLLLFFCYQKFENPCDTQIMTKIRTMLDRLHK